MSKEQGKRAVVLVSGGMDSAVCLAWAHERGFTPFALSFRYGQRHGVELEAARRVVAALGAAGHLEMAVDLSPIGASALTDMGLAVPKEAPSGIPATYVPARNTIFLALALGWAESLGAHDLVIGANAVDYSGYPDCRPPFIEAFQTLANLATREGVEGRPFRVHAPLLSLGKGEIVALGKTLGVDFAWTHTCYDPDDRGRACGQCDACRLRRKGFSAAGEEDPVAYC